MRAILVVLMSLFCGAAVAQSVPDQSPEELVRYVYQHYVGKKSTEDSSFKWTEQPLADRLFEPALARAVVRAGKSKDMVIDADPFVSGQDFEIASYDLKTESKTAERARIIASFKNFDQNVTVQYDLVRAKSGWRIQDVTSSGTSLRKTVKAR